MNKGQKVIAGLLAVIAVELLPVAVVGTRVVMGEVEVTYEVDDDELSEWLKRKFGWPEGKRPPIEYMTWDEWVRSGGATSNYED